MSTPFLKKRKNSSCNMKRDVLLYTSFRKNGGLAQLVRASASHAEGRRFESATLHQKQQAAIQAACCFWESPRADSKGAGVNDMPVACQSRDPARPQAGESATLHQRKQATQKVACFLWNRPRADAKGAGVNDMPVACQSRGPARPQAGESAAGRHARKLFRLPGQKSFFRCLLRLSVI